MLDELKKLHDEIEGLLHDLDLLTQSEAPRLDAVASTRLRLTRASRRRTVLLDTKVYPAVLESSTDAERRSVEKLRDEGRQALLTSVGHIGRWTIGDIEERWKDYQVASREMQRSMVRRVKDERDTLYALLHRQVRHSG